MKLIETKTLVSAAASIEFTSIPQDGTDLFLLINGRTTGSGNTLNISFNSSTTGFTNRTLQANGASVSVFSNYVRYAGIVNSSSETANTFSNSSIYIPNYTLSNNKSYSSNAVSENNATTAYSATIAGFWANTAAITSITLTHIDSNLAAGSTVSLYKITKGSDGVTTVS